MEGRIDNDAGKDQNGGGGASHCINFKLYRLDGVKIAVSNTSDVCWQRLREITVSNTSDRWTA